MSYGFCYPRTTPSPKLPVESGSERFGVLLSKDIEARDREFMTSLRDQLESRGGLSSKQIACLVRTEAKYDEEAVERRACWSRTYASDHRPTAMICAKYYLTTSYFQDLAHRVLNEDDFIPTERQYEAMCCNGYAVKAIASATQPPLFPIGALCKVRKNQQVRSEHHNELALVVANHASGLYASSAVIVNGETVIYEDRMLKPHSPRRRR